MALRVRFQFGTGQALGYAVERLADGLFLDFATGTFTATPGTPVADLTEGTDRYAGLYRATLDPTPVEQFPDGEYQVTIHDTAAAAALVAGGLLSAIMHGGDDTPFFPGSGVGGAYTPADVWNYVSRTVDLRSTGLDAIPVTDPGAPANVNTITRAIVAIYRRLYGQVTKTPTQIQTYANDGTTVNTTQTYSDNGSGTQSMGPAS
jgi:hypothetical protein